MNRQRRSAGLLSQLIGLNILKYVKDSCKFQTSIWNKILDLLRVTVGLPEEAASFAQQQAGCQHRCRRARVKMLRSVFNSRSVEVFSRFLILILD